MRMPGYIFGSLLMLALPLGNLHASQGAKVAGDIAVVVNAANPVNELSLPELRKMLTGDRRFWKGNVQVKLVLREPGSRERDDVLSTLLKTNNKDFAELWRAKVFRGEAAEPPLALSSNLQAERYLLAAPGGIAFMIPKNLPPQLKILKLENKLPGEAGYALK